VAGKEDDEMNPTASVVVLTLNSERYIERCLNSLVRQSLEDFEILVVDAGSTDLTREIVARYDQRFRWLELPGSDMGAARNYGMRMSHGRYLMFLDSDDFYLREKLQRQVAALEDASTVDVMFCAAWHFRTGHPDIVGIKRHSAQPKEFRDFLEGRNHNLGTMCLRRRVWDAGFAFGEGDRGRYGEEWRLQLALAQHGVPMVYQREPLVAVEIRSDSHTTWSRQWMMKQQAISEVEHVASLLTPEQRSTVDVAGIIDDFRSKLVIGLLLDGQEADAERAAALISDSDRALQVRCVVKMARWLPGRLRSRLIRRLWVWRQDRSFEWQATPVAVRDEFAAVQRGMSSDSRL